MRKLTALLIILLAVFALCEAPAVSPRRTTTESTLEVLRDRIATEQDLRREAETSVAEARKQAQTQARTREGWQLAALAIGLLAIGGFIAGIGLGSKGKRDAEREPESA